MADKGKLNGTWATLRNIGTAVALVAVVVALLVTLLISPVKECAVEARELGKKNADDIHTLDVKVKGVEKDVGNMDKNVERLMGVLDIPTVREKPTGELLTDPPAVEEAP